MGFRQFFAQTLTLLSFYGGVSFPIAEAAGPRVALEPTVLAELAAATSNKVPEISRARALAASFDARLCVYGGTSRELIEYVQGKVQSLGSVDAYRRWLTSQPSIRLLDWHRIASDLDFMLVPRDPDRSSMEQLEKLKSTLYRDFPSSVFYSKFDINIESEFFKKYPVGDEHFEAISNIPISERGVERLPELRAKIGDRDVDLSAWGLRQLVDRKFDFRLNPKRADPRKEGDVFGDLRQALRWIRYESEHPEVELPESSRQAIRTLLADAVRRNPGKVSSLLRGEGESKIIDAIEKLQLYSKDSERTHRLLKDYGIIALAEKAGVSQQRIYEPLRTRSAEAETSGKRIGREVTLLHRASLPAVQNISKGALWQSNNKSTIQGSQTTAAYGAGLYAAENADALGYGDIYVKMVLSPDAVESVDYIRTNHGYWVIKTKNAIAKTPDGELKIEKVTQETLIRNQMDRLRQLMRAPEQTQDHVGEIESIYRSVGVLLDPFSDLRDRDVLHELINRSERISGEFFGTSLKDDLLHSTLLNNPQNLEMAIRSEDPFWKRTIDGFLKQEPQSHAAAEFKIAYLRLRPDGFRTMSLTGLDGYYLIRSREALQGLRNIDPNGWVRFLVKAIGGGQAPEQLLLQDPLSWEVLRQIGQRNISIAWASPPLLSPEQMMEVKARDRGLWEKFAVSSLRSKGGSLIRVRLEPENPADLRLLETLLPVSAQRMIEVNWLDMETFGPEGVTYLKRNHPQIWEQVLRESLDRGYPLMMTKPGSVYQFDAQSAVDRHVLESWISKRAQRSAEALMRILERPGVVDQPMVQEAVERYLPAMMKNERIHHLKSNEPYFFNAPRLLEKYLDLEFSQCQTKHEFFEAIRIPDTMKFNFASQEAKDRYYALLMQVAKKHEPRFLALAQGKASDIEDWNVRMKSVKKMIPASVSSCVGEEIKRALSL